VVKMKTLLTEKQVNRIHKGDNHSARMTMKIGKVFRKGLRFYRCVDKIIFKIHKCPHCGSTNSFHKRSQDVYTLDNNRKYDNVYKARIDKSKTTLIFQKIDYCLDCHKEFSIEIFCYTRISWYDYMWSKKL